MKHSLVKRLFPIVLAFAGFGAWAATKAVTWSLPANWAEDVKYPVVGDYRAIVGDELVPRSPMDAVGDPDLPFLRVNVDLPDGGTFVGVTATAEWTSVDLGGMWPLPIVQPVPTGNEPTIPPPSAAYGGVFPKDIAVAQPVQKLNGVKIVPVNVTPFRWDGATKTLYRATSLRVEATFEVTARPRLKMATAAAQTDSCPAADYGNDHTADFIIISPPAFVDLWKKYADFRVTTENGRSHTFAIKSTAAIYDEYANVGGDDAFKIHRYVEHLYGIGKIKYVLLGSAPKKYEYDPETMVPSRYIVVGSSIGQLSDEYYGCMDRNPFDASGNELGVEVWDYDGDGAYMGHKNANGGYSCDGSDKIDWTQEIVVFRFPLMREVVETRNNERIVLTAAQIMDNFIAKIKHVEGVEGEFPGRYGACLSGSTGFASSTYSQPSRSELFGTVVDERSFFDGGKNMFAPDHNSWSSDSEIVPRDRNWEFLTYLRGNDDDNVVLYNSSESKSTYADMYDHSGDVFNILAHGWARGCAPGSGTEAFFSTGYYTVYSCPIPCDSGMMDYCPSGSYGITNCICFGEAPVLAPHGGSLASFNNTRLGWSATFATSYNGGNGAHSHRMDWLLFRAMSGVHNKLGTGSTKGDGTGEPMDAGHALMYAKNNFNAGYYASAQWGLSGLEVTGQGDPLARFSPQYARVWKADAANGNWNKTDKNWKIPGKNDSYAADYSTDVFADLTGKGSFTFNIQTNLSSAGFFVKQDAGATLTITSSNLSKYRVTRETVITNGNLRWETAGGAGRFGVTFVGNRGNIELPGNAKRYFGEKFSNVGDILVSGGNVTIDTPRDAAYGSGKAVDFTSLRFIGADAGATNNVFRSRKASFLPDDFTIPVVGSELILQVTDNPRIAATNATVTVQANPLYENCYFTRPIWLNGATLVGDYKNFALGPADGTGFDLYVSGKCAIKGTTPIRLNGELRIHFEGDGAELEIANPLCDGTKAGNLAFVGSGKVRLTGAQAFTTKLTVPDGVEVTCAISEAVASSIEVADGGSLKLENIPLAGLADLTVTSGGELHLPTPTYTGTYKIVDATTTTLDIQDGAKVYDANGNEISGEQTQGHYVLAENQLVWAASGETWNKDAGNLTAWQTAKGAPSAYTDNSPLKFDDLGGGDVQVLVGEDVAPGFVDFRNTLGRYFFTALGGASPTVTFNSLVSTSPVTFDVPLKVPGGIMATGGSAQFGDITTPKVEIADGGSVRATGRVDIASQKVKRMKFVFSGTRGSGERAAVCELRLFSGDEHFYLPTNTVIRDIAGEAVTITGKAANYGHTMTGSVGDERLSALVDGTVSGGNKWWASKSASPTWFEITFPEPVEGITGYSIATSDQQKRDPKDWTVYAQADGETRYSLVASEDDCAWDPRRSWMQKAGNSPLDRFAIGTMSALARVRTGGRLVLDGTWNADLELEADATLVVTNACCLAAGSGCNRLLLPDSGTVKIDLSNADSASKAFPILTGYDITAAEFGQFECVTETAMLLLDGGDIYAATANVAVPPYEATVSGNADWSTLTFADKNEQEFNWGTANVKASGTVTLNVTADSVLTMDAVGTVASLVVTGGGKLTVAAADGITPLAPAVIDDSAHTGALVWNVPIGSAAVKAGKDTTINGGSVGTGLLTVGADKKVTLGAGVTFANREIDASGWVRFAGTRADFALQDWPAATYSFEDGALVGSFTLDGHTIKSAEGDYVKLVGTNDNYFARSLINFDISGGTVEVESNGETTWFGRTASAGKSATTFKMTGGTFRCLANGTGTGGGLLLGYEDNDKYEDSFALDISGGTFEVPDSFVNFGTPTIVNLTGSGILRAKGFTSSISPGTINLGTNVADNACSVEIGSLGFGSGAASVTMRDNATIVGYENGASFAGPVLLYASKWSAKNPKFYIGAKADCSMSLSDLAVSRFTSETGAFFNGSESLVFGDAANGLTGEIVIRDTVSMPDKWTVGGGTVNLGANRASASSVLTAQPSGKVVTEISYDEYSSGTAIEILNCGSWSDALTAEQLRGFITIRAEDERGDYREVSDGTVKSLGGIVNFLPEGASGYVFPISATVTQNSTWSELTWRDRNGIDYTNDWHGVTSVELVNESGAFVVTMDLDVTVTRLATRVTSGKTLTLTTSGSKKLTVTGKLDDATSAGTTVLDVALDSGVTIAAGKSLQIPGAANPDVPHGTLTIGAGSVATIVDGYWNGKVEMADSTSRLLYKSSKTLASVPSSQGEATVGYVEYYAPMTTTDALFGSADAKSADGLFYFRSGTDLSTARFVTGKGNGTVQKFMQDKNTSIVITGNQGASSDNPTFVLGSDLGSETTYYVLGGTFVSDNAPLVLGANGTANFMFYRSGDCYRLKGVTTNGKDNKSSFTLSGTMELGSDGIDIVSSIHDTNAKFYPFNWSGTIVAKTDTTVRVPGGIGIHYSGTFEPADGATITVRSPLTHAYLLPCYNIYVNGEGMVTIDEAQKIGCPFNLANGTLRLAERGLLNDSAVNFGGGKMEVLITRDEATMSGTSYKLFKTTADAATVKANTTVLAKETMSVVDGSYSVGSDGTVSFAPAAITNIKATSDAFYGNWEDLVWTNAKGEEVGKSVWNATLGTATLTALGTSRLTFGGNCAATEIKVVNSGDLAVGTAERSETAEGRDGTMTVTTLDDSASTGRTRIGGCFVLTDVAAGKDTVIEQAGSGTLTIAAGKRATIPGWSDPANVTGAGVVTLDAGARDALVGSSWSNASGVTGTNQVLRGTWEFTAGSQYPKYKEVLLTSTNAVMRFKTSRDITGYDNNLTQAVTIEDGAELQVEARDTFSRPMVLSNGGKLLFGADAFSNDGRIFDMFKNATISATGSEPCVIGGLNATANGYGEPIVNSGIVALRKSGEMVNVAKDATLKVYAQWGTAYSSDTGAGNAWTKKGAGTLEFYRSSGQTGTMTIADGIVRLVNNGQGTTGAIVNNARLEVVTASGFVKTMAQTITGSGTIVKSGAGTVSFGTARPACPVEIADGAIAFTLTENEKRSNDWIALYRIGEKGEGGEKVEIGENVLVYDVDGTTLANVVETKVENSVVSVKVEMYRMPISLTVTTAQEKDWVNADWEDANGVHVDSAAWAGLLAKTNLTLAITANYDLILNVNTNVTAIGLTLGGAGAVAFNSIGGHALNAEKIEWGEGVEILVTGITPAIAPLSEGVVPADWRVKVADGATWTNRTLTVSGRVAVAYSPDVKPFDGAVSFGASATLAITMDDFTTIVPLTDAALTIDPATTILVNGVARPAGTWTVSGGSINLPVNAPLKATASGAANWNDLVWTDSSSTPVTVPSAYWEQASEAVDVTLTVNGATTLTLDQAVKVKTLRVTGPGELTMPTSDFTIERIAGDGTIVCNGFWPSYAGLTDATAWTGTVKLTGTPSEMKYYTFADIGNAASKIDIAGTVYGYLQATGDCRCESALKISGTLRISNGNSWAGYTFAGALSGAGLLETQNSPKTTIRFTGDVADFAGTIKVGGGHCVVFGSGATSASTVGKIVVSDTTLTLKPGQLWSAANGIEVRDGARIDCDMGTTSGEDLAGRAVGGVPYTACFTLSKVTGTIGIKGGTPTMPKGYALTEDASSGYTVVVTAPEKAKFGVVSMNLHHGTALSGAGDHGLYADTLANWGNLKAEANKSATVSNVTFTIGGNASGYGISTCSDEIYRQYLDDSGTTRTISISDIPFGQYRLIVYFSTDTEGYQFQPFAVNDGTGDMWYAGAQQGNTTKAYTVKGRNATWGHSGPDQGMNAMAEGVNLLMTDVMTSPTATLKFTRVGNPRATPCAIQIVRVGEIAWEKTEVDPSQTDGVIPVTSTNEVKVVCVWTNGEEEAKLDLTPAFTLTKVEGGVKAELKAEGSVTVGEETIAVTPELTEEDDEQVAPLTVGDNVEVGVRTVPGLTYELLRGSVPDKCSEMVATERAKGPRTRLTDDDKPSDKAFYIIRVGR